MNPPQARQPIFLPLPVQPCTTPSYLSLNVSSQRHHSSPSLTCSHGTTDDSPKVPRLSVGRLSPSVRRRVRRSVPAPTFNNVQCTQLRLTPVASTPTGHSSLPVVDALPEEILPVDALPEEILPVDALPEEMLPVDAPAESSCADESSKPTNSSSSTESSSNSFSAQKLREFALYLMGSSGSGELEKSEITGAVDTAVDVNKPKSSTFGDASTATAAVSSNRRAQRFFKSLGQMFFVDTDVDAVTELSPSDFPIILCQGPLRSHSLPPRLNDCLDFGQTSRQFQLFSSHRANNRRHSHCCVFGRRGAAVHRHFHLSETPIFRSAFSIPPLSNPKQLRLVHAPRGRRRTRRVDDHPLSVNVKNVVEATESGVSYLLQGGPAITGIWGAAKIGFGVVACAGGHAIVGAALVAYGVGTMAAAAAWGNQRHVLHDYTIDFLFPHDSHVAVPSEPADEVNSGSHPRRENSPRTSSPPHRYRRSPPAPPASCRTPSLQSPRSPPSSVRRRVHDPK